MKVKTIQRIGGAINVGVWGLAGYFCQGLLSNYNYNFFVEDHPIEYKLGGVVYLSAVAAFVPISVLGITDGLVDIVKGTHHYFACRLWQKLARSQKTKDKIQSDLEAHLKRIEEEI
jgi:hypothetical protein